MLKTDGAITALHPMIGGSNCSSGVGLTAVNQPESSSFKVEPMCRKDDQPLRYRWGRVKRTIASVPRSGVRGLSECLLVSHTSSSLSTLACLVDIRSD